MVGIDDATFFPGHLTTGGIERDRVEVRLGWGAYWNADTPAAAAVGVDNQIDRGAADGLCVGIEHEVFQPYARMKQLGLMTSHHDRALDPVSHVGRAEHVVVTRRVFR